MSSCDCDVRIPGTSLSRPDSLDRKRWCRTVDMPFVDPRWKPKAPEVKANDLRQQGDDGDTFKLFGKSVKFMKMRRSTYWIDSSSEAGIMSQGQKLGVGVDHRLGRRNDHDSNGRVSPR